MTAQGWLQIGIFAVAVLALTKPLGVYMFRVFEGDARPWPRTLGALERGLLRLCGVRSSNEQEVGQGWRAYTAALLAWSAIGVLGTYAIERLQQQLPLNPQHLAPP